MKILEWIFPYFPTIGGRERFVQKLITGLQKQNHDVYAVVATPPNGSTLAPELNGISTFTINPYLSLFPSRQNEFIKEVDFLVNQINQNKIDVIHFHNSSTPDLNFLKHIKSVTGIPIVLTLHAQLGGDRNRGAMPVPPADLVDKFVAISEFIQIKSIENSPFSKSKFELIRNGVNIPSLDDDSQADYFLYFGRFSSEKGIAQLLVAFQIFLRIHPESKLRLIGDGPERKIITQMCDLLGISSNVFIGHWINDSDLKIEIQNAKAVVVPSIWNEPFGLVAAEAMANSKPVIHTNVGALPEILGVDGECGIGFENGDVVRLVSALISIQNDPEKASIMGSNGRSRAEKLFNFNDMLVKYENLFHSLKKKS